MDSIHGLLQLPIANTALAWLVIWQSMMSSPLRVARTSAGRRLVWEEVGEWKVQDDDVSSYKSAQAASSSGESQSFIKEDSAKRVGAASSAFLDLREWMTSKVSKSFSCTPSNS